MDSSTLGAAIGIIKGMPDSDISRAEEAASEAEGAASRAESAATVAVAYGKLIEIEGTKLIIGERSGD